MNSTRLVPLILTLAAISTPGAPAQNPPDQPPGFDQPFPGPGGRGPGGMGGPGGPMGQETKVLEQFDADHNRRLDAEERKAARAWLAENRPQRGRGRGPGGFGGPPGGPGGPPGAEGGREIDPNAKGATVDPHSVTSFPGRDLFDPDIVRTFFIDLPQADWFEELCDFYRTDVEVPATVSVDGQVLHDVGTGFRGNTSYMMAQGKKKSWNLDFGFVDAKQHLLGVRHLDLLNSNEDPSFLRETIHGWIANQYFPSPRVALVRLVVNGEDFGIYAAVEQFDKEFLQAHFGTKQGDRWKIPPDFSGSGGLRWLGEDPQAYRRNYQIKTKDDPRAWSGLVDLCAVLADTPTDDLERILPQHLDVEAALWFLAIDNALGDDDGYESRASDYLLYRDPKGRFHPIPRDNNEILPAGGGRGPRPGPGGAGPGGFGMPGQRRGPGGGPGGGPGSAASTPMQMADREDRPLLHRLLQVPAWRERYLANLHELASNVMTPQALGKRIDTWHQMIGSIVAGDVHALYGAEAFEHCFAADAQGKPVERSLLAIIDQRRRAILQDAALQGAWPTASDLQIHAQPVQGGRQFVLDLVCRAGGTKIREVRLHHDQGTFGSYATAPMFDDGQHGEGEANDGVYAASLPGIEAGVTWRFWVEVVAEDGHVACLPAGGGALPVRWTAPKPNSPKK